MCKGSGWNGSTLSDVPAYVLEMIIDGAANLFDDYGDGNDGSDWWVLLEPFYMTHTEFEQQ